MSTPTPRTQALYLKHANYCDQDEADEAVEDFRDLARKLEAELAEQQWLHESAIKRAKELTKELAAEREKVWVLRSACESICEEWGRNHDSNPIGAGQRMETMASKALEDLEEAQ